MPHADIPSAVIGGVGVGDICINFPDNSAGSKNRSTAPEQIIDLDLNVLDQTLNFRITVQDVQAHLADIVPLARVLCDKVIDIALQNASQNHTTIPCLIECSACCSYLVPLSVPEALRFAEELQAIPEEQRECLKTLCLFTASKILMEKPPESFANTDVGQPPESQNLLQTISDWYRSLNLSCPFLHQRICTVRDNRPLACRQYFVTGSEKQCNASLYDRSARRFGR